MKKIYMAPDTLSMKIHVSQIVCASDATLSISDEDRIESASGFGSRRRGGWSDDDEE